MKVETRGGQHVFEVASLLRDLDPAAVRVELYADAVQGGAPARQEMKRVGELAGAPGGYIYSASMPADRPPTGLHSATDPAPRRRGPPAGGAANSLAAMIITSNPMRPQQDQMRLTPAAIVGENPSV